MDLPARSWPAGFVPMPRIGRWSNVFKATGSLVRGMIACHRLGHSRAALPLLIDFRVDHLPHGIEPRAVKVDLVAGLDQRAAVERREAGDGVFHLQSDELRHSCRPTTPGGTSPPSRRYSSAGQGGTMPGGIQGPAAV